MLNWPKHTVLLQLESTFAESALVRRAHLESLRDWQKDRPLDALILGKLDLSAVNPAKIRPSAKTDATVRGCMHDFREEIFKVKKPFVLAEQLLNKAHSRQLKYVKIVFDQHAQILQRSACQFHMTNDDCQFCSCARRR